MVPEAVQQNGEILTQFEGFLHLLSVLLVVINPGGREPQYKLTGF